MVYFIPTPIGNLDDISQRSLKLLCECHTLFCEDTRITKKLLSLLSERHNLEFNIENFISLHSHNEKHILDNIDLSIFDETVAYLSDAGMPCISDPGSYFVLFCQEKNINYEIVPGANAALLAYASSGFLNPKFTFFGFLPHKGKERIIGLEEIKNSPVPMIVYESPHRIEKLIEELAKLLPNRRAIFIKEATKKFERRFVGTCIEIKEEFKEANLRGEWVIVIDSDIKEKGDAITKEDILNLDLPPKQKAKLLAKVTGESVKDWYNQLLS
ncbi:16S rRNA (cytidine(1402)-2'-O)-methyltransferase [Sulfurospirillum arcachonense]|uniref:16S rRNA (cytidine(1402)-2'-O)-methyltransferase n=1 Tax=Sulfurospirillum arcachonense TaxID=57666 RepID=UPI0004690BD7|nr:16S rRNA (cytidine(1402)-2'-O)-methyltransferase [Sulfurospirillum arcachonense]